MKRLLFIFLCVGLLACSNWQEKLDSVSQGIDSLTPPLETHRIDLDVQGQKLALNGRVSSMDDKFRVRKLAESRVGSSNVIDNLVVVPQTNTALRAEATSLEVQAILNKVASVVPKGVYTISAGREGEIIVLKGSVSDSQTKDQITRLAREAVPGATIRNELREVPPLPDALVLSRVKERLNSEMPELLSKLSVSCENGIVAFSGNVANHREIDRVLATTIMVEGVRDVRSTVNIHG